MPFFNISPKSDFAGRFYGLRSGEYDGYHVLPWMGTGN